MSSRPVLCALCGGCVPVDSYIAMESLGSRDRLVWHRECCFLDRASDSVLLWDYRVGLVKRRGDQRVEQRHEI